MRTKRGNGGWLAGRVLAALCALPLLLPAATIVHRPYLQNMGADHVTILWSTRENQSAVVQYSTGPSFDQTVTASVRVFTPATTQMSVTFYQYRADLTGLAAGTDYFYRIVMNGEALTTDPGYQFHTAGPGPFRFLVFGDSGSGNANQLALTQRMIAETPNFALQVGDIAYEDGTFEQFQNNYFEYYWTLLRKACFFLVAGNHEYVTPDAAPFRALTVAPTDGVPPQDAGRYYSFDWGDAHFVGLDSNLLGFSAATTRMLSSLDADLARTTARWRIVFFHHLPYPVSQHVDDPVSTSVRQRIVPIVERRGVQLVLTGHEHSYMRSRPMRGDAPVSSGTATTYITTGGGGGTPHQAFDRDFLAREGSVYHYLRVDVDGPQMVVRAITRDGSEFDRFTLTLPSVAGGDSVLNGASFSTALAPGALISIFGQGLAATTTAASAIPLPTVLGGAAVSLNGNPLSLIYASPGQINAQLPLNVQGPATLRVATTAGYAEVPVTISDTAPAIFTGGILHANYSPVSPASPARPGETLIVYMTGLGAVDGAIQAGDAAPASPLINVTAPILVNIGGSTLAPSFAGLAPGFAGLYQVNVAVPDLPPQTYPLRVTARGNPSNSMNILVQK